MQLSALVLILMGQCSLCLCLFSEDRLVKQPKTWEEAQTYCRAHHTDLVTVQSSADMEALGDSAGGGGDAWIGLRRETSGPKTWHWSMPGVELTGETKWRQEEPNDRNSAENCVAVERNQWLDLPCNNTRTFVCYEQTKKKFHFKNALKTWREARSVCRDQHTDLVSGLTQLRDRAFRKELKDHQHQQVWIGLFGLRWRWSDGSTFRPWDPEQFEDRGDEACAAVSDGNWKFDECKNKKYFFCSTDELILVKEPMTWERALTHCRDNQSELVSVTNAEDQASVQEIAKEAGGSHVWMGLRYSCTLDLWFWVSNKAIKYKNWEPGTGKDDCDMSGAMATRGEHKWSKKSANKKFRFICFKR